MILRPAEACLQPSPACPHWQGGVGHIDSGQVQLPHNAGLSLRAPGDRVSSRLETYEQGPQWGYTYSLWMKEAEGLGPGGLQTVSLREVQGAGEPARLLSKAVI
jgi:hypothetical protein